MGGEWSQGLLDRTWALNNNRSVTNAATLKIKYPFNVDSDHHYETSLRTYQRIASFLDLVASQLGKNRSMLSIFDPYFCAGATKECLRSLGLHSVCNECEDFYNLICEGRVPPYDVLVTAPPYAKVHM